MHDLPPSLAARLPGLHEIQEQREGRNVIAVAASDFGVSERDWGDGLWSIRTATSPKHGPGNQLTGLTALDVTPERLHGILVEVVPWFDEVGSGCRARLLAAELDEDLGRTLASAGFVVEEVEAWMAAPLDTLEVDAPTIDIRVADDATSLDDFLRAFCAGWKVSTARGQAIARAALAPIPGPSFWRRYVAYVDGEPAGEAMLAWFDDVAYLAEAATAPAHRRRGVQRALIARRLADARALDCKYVFSSVQYGDPSWANMRGRGLREANMTVAFRRPPNST